MSAVDPAGATIVVAGISAGAAVVGTWLTTRRGSAAARDALEELRPNHGSSTRDAINRIANVVDRMDARLNRQEDRSDRHGAELAKVGAAVGAIGARLERGDERFERIEQRLAESGPQQITIVNPKEGDQ